MSIPRWVQACRDTRSGAAIVRELRSETPSATTLRFDLGDAAFDVVDVHEQCHRVSPSGTGSSLSPSGPGGRRGLRTDRRPRGCVTARLTPVEEPKK